nr:hypothetical protein KitaXyl93_69400 [Kitasatospora sp. Xyl93]
MSELADRTPAPPLRTGDPAHPHKARAAARLVARTLLVLTGVAAVALGFARFTDTYDEVFAYRDAPACAALAGPPATDCTTRETGRVTGRKTHWEGENTSHQLTVSREAAPDRTYYVSEDLYDSTRTGADVDLTLWNGRVVELSHGGHRNAIITAPWRSVLELSLLIGAGTALAVQTLLRGHRTGWKAPAAAYLVIAFLAFFGSTTMITIGLAFAIALTVGITGWLVLTAGVTVLFWNTR